MILVSACLLGLNTKYNGDSNCSDLISMYMSLGKFIPVCPEQLGGLPTPRPPSEISCGSGHDVLYGGKKVISIDGNDVTRQFINGAREVLKIARDFHVKYAILKEKSPSCGSTQIYDGTFSGRAQPGEGVTAALLRENGIIVYSEKDLNRENLERLLKED